MEITRQADYYGTDAPERDPAPSPEKVAELLTPAPIFERSYRVEEHGL